jgi:hypothetical protein
MGRAASPLRDRVIFVEGAPRSGTTWLVTLLATHPEIAGVDAESHLFDFGADRLFDNFEHRDPDYHGLRRYVERDELVDAVRDLCDSILMAMRARVSVGPVPPFVVEKTPIRRGANGLDLARKAECYPDAWYVHIVRDREAVARSLMRSPWMPDRSYEACADLWDRAVGHAREHLGDLPRYREMSYEDLRADPAKACKELFEWFEVDAGEPALETVRTLSREPFSDVGAVAAEPSRSVVGALRRRASGAKAALRQRLDGGGDDPAPGSPVPFVFAIALLERDGATLRSLTAPKLEFVLRSPAGDRVMRGDEAREALVELADEAFGRRYVSEWWAAPNVAPAMDWTSVGGKPLATVFVSAIGGDRTRLDMACALLLEDELVRRAVIVSAGPLSGRPIGD